MKEIISIKNLDFKFGKKTILSNVNLSIKEGEIYGIVGNNGAGKTTLLKLVCGLLKPTAGNVLLKEDASNPFIIGTLIESPGLYSDMSAYENIKAKALSMGLKYTKENINDLLCVVGLEDVGKKRVRAFSMGMKQRLGIAIALVGNPKLLILDEPMNGLDPEGVRDIENLILKIRDTFGTTIMVSSHMLAELVKIVTRICVIHKGQVYKEFSQSEFIEQCGEKDINSYYLSILQQN